MAIVTIDLPDGLLARVLSQMGRGDTQIRISLRPAVRRISGRDLDEMVWEVDFTANDGGVYRMLTEGVSDEQGADHNKSQ